MIPRVLAGLVAGCPLIALIVPLRLRAVFIMSFNVPDFRVSAPAVLSVFIMLFSSSFS